nr:MAG TPA: hypothetical protein [Caudoviricetes sp.]
MLLFRAVIMYHSFTNLNIDKYINGGSHEGSNQRCYCVNWRCCGNWRSNWSNDYSNNQPHRSYYFWCLGRLLEVQR